jgi:hypothetical protein
MKGYLARYIEREKEKNEIPIREVSANSAKTPGEVGFGTFGTSSPQVYPVIFSDQTCHHCGAVLLVRQFRARWELECSGDPTHYNEHRRKPESDRLWEDVPTPEEGDWRRTLHYALEGKQILGAAKTGTCEVGCGNEIQFYFLEGVGYGHCPSCRVDQRIERG